jgi:hypothetical protein
MRVLLVIAGVVGSCSAGLVMGGVSVLLPTGEQLLEAGHGDGRQLAAGAGFENCTNATKAGWETCRTAVKSAFPGQTTTCGGYDKFEAEFKCDVDFIFTCADLRIVENDLRKQDMCSSLFIGHFKNAPTACPPKAFPNIAAVVGKACDVHISAVATPRPTFSFEVKTPSPTLSSEEAVCMTFVAGCLRPFLLESSGLSPSNLALPEKLSKLKTDKCYFDGSWREDYFKCLNTGPPSCAATIATECSTIFQHTVEASEKACKERYPTGYPEVRSGCSIKSDWWNPYFILGGVVALILFYGIPRYVKSYMSRRSSQVEYKTSNGVATVAVGVHIPDDATPVTVADLFPEGRK